MNTVNAAILGLGITFAPAIAQAQKPLDDLIEATKVDGEGASDEGQRASGMPEAAVSDQRGYIDVFGADEIRFDALRILTELDLKVEREGDSAVDDLLED